MQNDPNKLSRRPVGSLLWEMGLPMIVSMVLQAVYNIVDTAFVINMGEDGAAGNLALTYSFPIQLLIIAIGVGTGVGLNALLSRSLGAGEQKKAAKTVGNGIFLGLVLYGVFLLFGLFGARPFIAMQGRGDERVIEMGTQYLGICCCGSFGAIGFTIFERFLQSTGKTLWSTVSQISGAVCNIVLDYVFLYPLKMGVAGAAWATVIGQVLSLAVAAAFHFLCNGELRIGRRDLLPDLGVIREIYHIGLSAALMQGLLSVMMLGVNLILGRANDAALLQGSFGIYYKIMQFALFACFGLSNTVITVLSYHYGREDRERSRACVKWGVIDTLAVSFAIAVLFECFARPLAGIFGFASGTEDGEIIGTVTAAIRIASTGFVFMGLSVAVQGVLQALGYALRPLVISCLRLAVFVFPAVFLFTLNENALALVWWAFPISECLTAAVSCLMLAAALRQKLAAPARGAAATVQPNV